MTGSPATGLARVMRRLQLLVGLGRIRIGHDSDLVQLQQVQFNDRETQDEVPRIAEYGFASMPLPGCQALVLFIGGERSNGAIVATNDERNRMKNLQPGEVAIYDDQGQSVYISRAGIVINGGGKQVTITGTPKVRMETSLEVTGDVKDQCDGTGKTMAGMRTTYDGHTHTDPQGGAVDVPNQQM